MKKILICPKSTWHTRYVNCVFQFGLCSCVRPLFDISTFACSSLKTFFGFHSSRLDPWKSPWEENRLTRVPALSSQRWYCWRRQFTTWRQQLPSARPCDGRPFGQLPGGTLPISLGRRPGRISPTRHKHVQCSFASRGITRNKSLHKTGIREFRELLKLCFWDNLLQNTLYIVGCCIEVMLSSRLHVPADWASLGQTCSDYDTQPNRIPARSTLYSL